MGDPNDDQVTLLDQEQPVEETQTDKSEKQEIENKDQAASAVATTSASSEIATVNVTETSAPGEVKSQNDRVNQSQGSELSNINIEEVSLDKPDENNCDEENEDMKKKATLLEQALSYRQQNPEKWQQRQTDDLKQLEESYGIYKADDFLDSYYKRLGELKIEATKKEESQNSLPATISLQLEFNKPRKRKSKDHSNPVETYESMSVDGMSIFDNDSNFFDMFKSNKDDVRGKEPELLITVLKGKYLQNALRREKGKLKICRLKCKFYPDCLKHGPKLKTSYTLCNRKSSTRWNHVFVMKGFTEAELSTKHVVLELVGKTDEGKIAIAEFVLAGRKAEIDLSDSESSNATRTPTSEECAAWEEALRKPGMNVTTTVKLSPTTLTVKPSLRSRLADKMKEELGMNNNNNNNNKSRNNNFFSRRSSKRYSRK